MALLTRDQLLAPDPVRHHQFSCGAVDVRIRNLTEGEKSKFENSILTSKGSLSVSKLDLARCRLIALCVVDAQGRRLLSDADAEALLEKDGALTARIYDECRKHCGFDEDDIETLAKNSDRIAGGSSQSD